jgi:hypothetical protein
MLLPQGSTGVQSRAGPLLRMLRCECGHCASHIPPPPCPHSQLPLIHNQPVQSRAAGATPQSLASGNFAQMQSPRRTSPERAQFLLAQRREPWVSDKQKDLFLTAVGRRAVADGARRRIELERQGKKVPDPYRSILAPGKERTGSQTKIPQEAVKATPRIAKRRFLHPKFHQHPQHP